MLPIPEELKSALEQLLPGCALTVESGALLVPAGDLIRVCRLLKTDERFSLDYLSDLTVVDYLPAPPKDVGGAQAGPADHATSPAGRMDVVYHLYSMSKKHGPLTLKVKLPRATPNIASVTPIWRGAEFQEREAYDLFGVIFEHHPDLRRILLWDGFDGHPMRKDYVVEDQNALEAPS